MATKMKSVLGKRARPSKQPEAVIAPVASASSEEDSDFSNPISGESDSDEDDEDNSGEEESDEDEDLPANLPTYAEVTKNPLYEVGENGERQCVLCEPKKIQNTEVAEREHLTSKLHLRRVKRFEDGLANTPADELPDDPRTFAFYVDEQARLEIETKLAEEKGHAKPKSRTQNAKTRQWSLNRKLQKVMKRMKALSEDNNSSSNNGKEEQRASVKAEADEIMAMLADLQKDLGHKDLGKWTREEREKRKQMALEVQRLPKTIRPLPAVPGLPQKPDFEAHMPPADKKQMSVFVDRRKDKSGQQQLPSGEAGEGAKLSRKQRKALAAAKKAEAAAAEAGEKGQEAAPSGSSALPAEDTSKTVVDSGQEQQKERPAEEPVTSEANSKKQKKEKKAKKQARTSVDAAPPAPAAAPVASPEKSADEDSRPAKKAKKAKSTKSSKKA